MSDSHLDKSHPDPQHRSFLFVIFKAAKLVFLHLLVLWAVLWSRSRPELEFFAGASEKALAPGCCCVA